MLMGAHMSIASSEAVEPCSLPLEVGSSCSFLTIASQDLGSLPISLGDLWGSAAPTCLWMSPTPVHTEGLRPGSAPSFKPPVASTRTWGCTGD